MTWVRSTSHRRTTTSLASFRWMTGGRRLHADFQSAFMIFDEMDCASIHGAFVNPSQSIVSSIFADLLPSCMATEVPVLSLTWC